MNSALKKPDDASVSNTIQPSPKRIVFIQLNRLGDLIQTAQIARELKEQRPDIRIDIVARAIFSRQINEILSVSFDNIYQVGLDRFLTGKSTLAQESHSISSVIDEINACPVSILINQSFSKSSAILSSLICSSYRFGMYVDNLGETIIADKWSQYIYSTVMSGNFNDIHLNDIFRLMIGINLVRRDEVLLKTDSEYLAISPFSSHARKSWRLEKWTEIIYQILKKDSSISISLLGAPSDEDRLVSISQQPLLQSFKNRIHIRAKQSINETFKIIQQARLYLGHDSLCSNLASLAKTKSIIVSLGTVRHQETFSDGVGNFVLAPKTNCYPCFPEDSCSNFKCHADINYNVVSEVVTQVFATGTINNLSLRQQLNEFQLSQCDIFVSTQRTNNLLGLENILTPQLNLSSFARGFYRISWLYYFEEISETFGTNLTVYPDTSALTNFQNSIGQLFDLCQHGTSFCRYILEEVAKDSPCITTIKDLGRKIDEIDQLLGKISSISPILTPICRAVLLKKSQIQPGHLIHLTEQTFLIYNEGVTLCKIISELTKNAIERNQKTKQNNNMTVDV